MHERDFSVRTYIIVCASLLILTATTVGVSRLPIAGQWHLAIGLLIALAKAVLVALIFMHVLHSPRLTVAVILVSCFWLLILFSLVLTDYTTRGGVNYLTGQ